MRVQRFDASVLPVTKAERTSAGWLKAPAFLTRTGIFEYRMADGSVRRELRLPDDVFAADALGSFSMVPVTDGHPDPAKEPRGLTADNVAHYQVGQVGENIHPEGDKVAAVLMITSAKAIEKVLAGKTQLSCGYDCETDETPGEWNGQRYDAIQRRIRGNHVALVDVARGGPEIRLRLDSADGAMVASDGDVKPPNPKKQRSQHMRKFVIDGIEFEVSEQVHQAFSKREAVLLGEAATEKARAIELKAAGDKQTARADSAEGQVKKLEAELAAATDPAKLAAIVDARAGLVAEARKHLGAEFKADGLDELAIKRAVVMKLDGEAKLDGKSADYVFAAYDYALKAHAKAPAAAATVRVDGDAAKADENMDPRVKLALEVSKMCEKSMEAAAKK